MLKKNGGKTGEEGYRGMDKCSTGASSVSYRHNFIVFYAPEGTSGDILKSHRQSVRPSVTNRVSAISHKLLKQI